MEKIQKDFQKLHQLGKHTRVLQGISSLLDWDQETYMPQGSSAIRAEQLKTMAGLIHREKTSKKFANALAKLIDLRTGEVVAKDLTPQQTAAVKEWHRDYVQDTSLPAKFVEDFAKLTSQSIVVWRNAKKSNAFQQFAPFLDKIVSMNRKKADLLGYQEHPYDALIDQFEPDMKTKEVDAVFSKLRDAISPLIKKMAAQPVDDQFLFGKWDQSKQVAFSHKILEAMGYDADKGRVDFSSHPFSSSSHPTDSRITTRIHPNSLMSNIFVILHEGGHALYEMGLPQDSYGTPLGDARSLGVHESQSRWWETRIGLSKPFWKHFLPILKEIFKGQLDTITLDQFYRAINKVEPSFIRVEADEVTYPLHVILRFELEKALIEGSISVRDVPAAWNAKMEEYLGIRPENNAEGCLQDIHWAMGAFGYFPTYTLGNLYAAHLFEAFAKQYPDWEDRVAEGKLDFIKQWLHEKIYQHGRRYTTQELLKQATGHAFSADAYVQYLQSKYGKIYQL
ncbi:putative Zn-dependent thermostable carboxypeptidase [Candidatus Protochlamydia naegleriophila]|uniref:Metal-dependent carboxypeptidase n=1 Tax=Candidatus Protochlamydia naegleriophila TaxID=389348 RepID=A0A0U5JD54_9BACT|nr:carboxypeptidase M32 [Candidatus Protochlamydia naegleriophila]CUI17037.1 putative Zn-dependent thermostable carboxypeptidase [Candidatus Protochlamydia naegleriophila]